MSNNINCLLYVSFYSFLISVSFVGIIVFDFSRLNINTSPIIIEPKNITFWSPFPPPIPKSPPPIPQIPFMSPSPQFPPSFPPSSSPPINRIGIFKQTTLEIVQCTKNSLCESNIQNKIDTLTSTYDNLFQSSELNELNIRFSISIDSSLDSLLSKFETENILKTIIYSNPNPPPPPVPSIPPSPNVPPSPNIPPSPNFPPQPPFPPLLPLNDEAVCSSSNFPSSQMNVWNMQTASSNEDINGFQYIEYFTCGERILWRAAQINAKNSEIAYHQAKEEIAKRYPVVCGLCSSDITLSEMCKRTIGMPIIYNPNTTDPTSGNRISFVHTTCGQAIQNRMESFFTNETLDIAVENVNKLSIPQGMCRGCSSVFTNNRRLQELSFCTFSTNIIELSIQSNEKYQKFLQDKSLENLLSSSSCQNSQVNVLKIELKQIGTSNVEYGWKNTLYDATFEQIPSPPPLPPVPNLPPPPPPITPSPNSPPNNPPISPLPYPPPLPLFPPSPPPPPAPPPDQNPRSPPFPRLPPDPQPPPPYPPPNPPPPISIPIWNSYPRGSFSQNSKTFSVFEFANLNQPLYKDALLYRINRLMQKVPLFHMSFVDRNWGFNVDHVHDSCVFVDSFKTSVGETTEGNFILPPISSNQESSLSLDLGCYDSPKCECEKDVSSMFCEPSYCPSYFNICQLTSNISWIGIPRLVNFNKILSVEFPSSLISTLSRLGIFDFGGNLLSSVIVSSSSTQISLPLMIKNSHHVYFKGYDKIKDEEILFSNLVKDVNSVSSVILEQNMTFVCQDETDCSQDCSIINACTKSCGRCPSEFLPRPEWIVKNAVWSPNDIFVVEFFDMNNNKISNHSDNTFNANNGYFIDSLFLYNSNDTDNSNFGLYSKFNTWNNEFTTNSSYSSSGLVVNKANYFDNSMNTEKEGDCIVSNNHRKIMCFEGSPIEFEEDAEKRILEMKFDCESQKIVPDFRNDQKLQKNVDSLNFQVHFIISANKVICDGVQFDLGTSIIFYSENGEQVPPIQILKIGDTYQTSFLWRNIQNKKIKGLGGSVELWNSFDQQKHWVPKPFVWEDYKNTSSYFKFLKFRDEVVQFKVKNTNLKCAQPDLIQLKFGKYVPRTQVLKECYLHCFNIYSYMSSQIEYYSGGTFNSNTIVNWKDLDSIGQTYPFNINRFSDEYMRETVCQNFQITETEFEYSCLAYNYIHLFNKAVVSCKNEQFIENTISYEKI